MNSVSTSPRGKLLKPLRMAFRTGSLYEAPTTGLIAQFRADEITSTNLDTTSSRNSVSSWNESIQGSSYQQSTKANQPNFNTSSKNGLPVANFDGANYALKASNNMGITANVLGFTIAGAINPSAFNATNQSDFYYFSCNSGGTVARFSGGFSSGASPVTAFMGGRHGDADTFETLTTTGTFSTGWCTFIAVYDLTASTGGVGTLYINGVSQTLGSNSLGFNTNPTGAGNSLSMTIGAAQNTSGFKNFFTGDIGEILFYNYALSAADVKNVDYYLNGRWAVH